MRQIIAKIMLVWVLSANLTPAVYGASLSTRVTYGRVQLSSYLQVIPNVAADVATTDTWIFQLTISNVTGAAATVTVTDKAATPLDLLKDVSIAANTTYVVAFPEGVRMKNGFTWVSGTASALNASVVAFRVP